MLKKIMCRTALALLLTTGLAYAEPPKAAEPTVKKEDAVIHFADFRGRIRDWRDDGRDAILIESDTGQWYRGEFMSPCHGLPFTETIGFPLDATRQVDKFSSIIIVNHSGIREQCQFKSFVEIPDPDKKSDKAKSE